MISLALVLVGIAASVLWAALSALEHEVPRDAAERALPSMVVIRPVRGLDPGLKANAEAALAQEYPGKVELLFVLDDQRDPSLPVLQSVLARHPDADARIVFAGPPLGDRTGKLHAMIRGLEQARSDAPLVCFADSDTRPGPTLIAELAAAAAASDSVGSAFAPVVCDQPLQTVGDVGYSLLLDGLYGPQAALAMLHERTLPFIMGQTMVLKREALEAAGGLEASEGQLVDDMHIGARMHTVGYRNVLVGARLPVVQGGLPWPAFKAVAVRWMTYSRTGIPFWPFNGPSVIWTTTYFAGLAGAAVSCAIGAFPTAAASLGLSAATSLAVELLRRRHGGAALPPRLWWSVPWLLTLLPVLYVQATRARVIEWRGRRYALDSAGRLSPG